MLKDVKNERFVKTCMLLLFICFAVPATSQQYSSVTDSIQVISREAEPISCIGIFDEKNRSLASNQLSSTTEETEENSACPSNHVYALYQGNDGSSAEFGGYLKFSLFGYPDTDFSITVSMETPAYQFGEVEMSVGTMKSSGSDVSTLGTAIPEYSKGSWDVLEKEPTLLVYGIDGNRTWTGSSPVDGIQIYYRITSGRKPYTFTVIYHLKKEK